MKEFIKVIIIEDENAALVYLENMIKSLDANIKIVATATNLEEARAAIQKHSPDLVFSDICLGSDISFSLFDSLETINFDIIFTTAYEEYALKAIKLSAFDYLLKPIDELELAEAIGRYSISRPSIAKERAAKLKELKLGTQDYGNELYIRTKDKFHSIKFDDIQYLLADGNYTSIHMVSGRILSSRTLKYYEDILDPAKFIRYSRFGIVNKQFIRKLDKKSATIITTDGEKHLISVRKHDSVLSLFNEK